MPNRLAKENSPYLLQHQDNPVDWYPWGEEALSRAKDEDKPIFLSIGYAACHWCHVMAHESFEDLETAKYMNEHFINIKVDREERPDLDGIYMSAVVSITGNGGWPMSVFLTPEGEPFYGGTYFPPEARYGMPSFQQVLNNVQNAWLNDRSNVHQSSSHIIAQLNKTTVDNQERRDFEVEMLDEAALRLTQSYDWKDGGWGMAPKFPQPMSIEFLLRRASRGDKLALDVATHALNKMASGGMYDVVGGGFSRYSVDNKWLVPHFEKMLYDNAQLARVYLHAYLITRNDFYRRICEQILDFVVREMTNEKGGFYSSLDADSEGIEGKFYVWSYDEIKNILEKPDEFAIFEAAYGITREGNFEGNNILQRVKNDGELAKQYNTSPEEITIKLNKLHNKLYAHRSKRVWPGKDDKVLVSWNGLMLIAFSEAARYLKREDYLEVAHNNADFLLKEMRPENRLLRSWREGIAVHNAYLEDHASLILGLLSIYQSDPDPRWYQEAEKLAEKMILHYQDPGGGFFDTRDDHEKLIIRPKELQDNATPSGNALAAIALFELAAYSGKSDWFNLASNTVRLTQEMAIKHPTSFGKWLCAMDFGMNPIQEIVILGDRADVGRQNLINTLWNIFRPHAVTVVSPFPPNENSPALVNDRPLVDGKATAYVCANFVCKQPVTSPKQLEKQLNH